MFGIMGIVKILKVEELFLLEIRIVNALKDYKKEQEENRKFYGDSYLCYYEKKVINEITKREQTKLIEANADI